MQTALPSKIQRSKKKAARLTANRVSSETLLHYAEFLPEVSRALLTAHLHLGMNTHELALLHQVTSRQMRRRLQRLRETLADPCFLLAAQYGPLLPHTVASLAHGFWIEGHTLRELARQRCESLHHIRHQLLLARSLLVIHLSSQRTISRDQACAALCQQFSIN